ncbi:uncharacterized protein LOC144116449 [Amblyomma americanum]
MVATRNIQGAVDGPFSLLMCITMMRWPFPGSLLQAMVVLILAQAAHARCSVLTPTLRLLPLHISHPDGKEAGTTQAPAVTPDVRTKPKAPLAASLSPGGHPTGPRACWPEAHGPPLRAVAAPPPGFPRHLGSLAGSLATRPAPAVHPASPRPGAASSAGPAPAAQGRGHVDVPGRNGRAGRLRLVAAVEAAGEGEEAHAPARLFNVFRGRTVADADQRAEGVSLPLSPGTLLCPCGAVMLHEEAHKAGDLHDQRTRGATTRDERHPAAATPSAAARQMLARAGREAEFAEWLLQVAARHAGGPPEPSLGSQPSAAVAPPSSAAAPPAPSDEARDPDPKRPAPALAATELPAPDTEAGATPAGGLEMDLDLWSTEIE